MNPAIVSDACGFINGLQGGKHMVKCVSCVSSSVSVVLAQARLVAVNMVKPI